MLEAAPLLSIENLTTAYSAHNGRSVAVDGIDLRVDEGETLGLVGESGCGKTTTVLSILRLLDPGGRITSGRVEFQGRNLLDLDDSQMRKIRGNGIAAIFQDAANALNPVFTIGEQIAESLRAHLHLDRRAARKRAEELLGEVGIPRPSERVGDYPHQLSGGMRRRVLIATAIACDPTLLMADEPTAALDAPTQVQILELINTLSQKLGMSMLLVTHDLGVAAEACGRIAVMYAGKIVEIAPTDVILSDPCHPYSRELLRAARGIREQNRGQFSDQSTAPNRAFPGCPYAHVCPEATDICRTAGPPEVELSDNHRVRCWLEGGSHD
ncbi:MAG: ABC transporter ATP-binding protein [Armatimonadota bacterium]